MYICLCHNVTDNDIRNCVEDGARSMRDLRRELGVASQCGKCACHAREVLKASLASPLASPVRESMLSAAAG